MDILLIRHGETQYNIEHRIYGHAQIPLTTRGRMQAATVGNRLKHTPLRAIYSSDLVRAFDTAQSIASHHRLDVHTDQRFREVNVGEWEHMTEAEVAVNYASEYAHFCKYPGEASYKGGESFVEVQRRAWSALNTCIANHQHDDTVCIVCHAGTISVIVCAVLQLNINHHPRLRLDNCAITRLVANSDGIALATLNDNTHAIQHTGTHV
jgi:broad specificity phosphatase PhoE